jgi:hypothetical protein
LLMQAWVKSRVTSAASISSTTIRRTLGEGVFL